MLPHLIQVEAIVSIAQMAKPDYPKTILEFAATFHHDDVCLQSLIQTRWPEGFVCPTCHHTGGGWENTDALRVPTVTSRFLHWRARCFIELIFPFTGGFRRPILSPHTRLGSVRFNGRDHLGSRKMTPRGSGFIDSDREWSIPTAALLLVSSKRMKLMWADLQKVRTDAE